MKKVWRIGIIVIIVTLIAGAFLYGKSQSETVVEEKIRYVAVEDQADEVVIEDEFILSINYIKNTILPASDLIVTRYNYKDADVYEDFKEINGHKIPLTTDKVLFTYEGTVSLGFDFSKIGYRIDDEKKIIFLTLPEIGIIANEIEFSSFEYYTISDSFLNKNSMEENTELISLLKDKAAARVIENPEILRDAEKNTQKLICSILGTEEHTREYRVVFGKEE